MPDTLHKPAHHPAKPGMGSRDLNTDQLLKLAAKLETSIAVLLVSACHALLLRSRAAGIGVRLRVLSQNNDQISTQTGLSLPAADEHTSFAALAAATHTELNAMPLRRDTRASLLFASRGEGSADPTPHPGTRLELQDEAGNMLIAVEELPSQLSLHASSSWAGGIDLLDTLPRLLDTATAQPKDSVARLPILASPDMLRRIQSWNDTGWELPANATVDSLVAQHAITTPDAIALRDGDTTLTYAQLNQEAEKLRAALHARGVRQGRVVAIAMRRDWRLVAMMLAVMKAGAATAPLDPNLSSQQISFLVAKSGAFLLVADTDTQTAGMTVPVANPAEIAAQQPEQSAAPVSGKYAYIQYSSRARNGVPIQHHALVNLLLAMRDGLGLQADDVVLALSPVWLDRAMLEIFLPLVCGGTLVLASAAQAGDSRAVASLLQQIRPTLCQATPSFWRMLLRAGWRGDKSAPMRILCGGEAVDSTLARRLIDQGGGQFWNLYGLTEACIWSTVECVTGVDAKLLPIGRPIPNTRAYVLDEMGRPVPPGVLGELWIGGIGVADGYMHDPTQTARCFRADPFLKASPDAPAARILATGDRARFRPDGRLEWHGRIANAAPLRGHRISLPILEAALMELQEVWQAAVVIGQDAAGNQELIAYVTAGIGKPSLARLRQKLTEIVPETFPARFVLLDHMPLTADARLDRDALPKDAPALIETQAQTGDAAVEAKLLRLFKHVLGTGSVRPTDDFFARGAPPMQAMQLLDLLHQEFGLVMTLDRFTFQASTPARLAAIIADPRPVDYPYLLPLQPDGVGTPLFCAHTLGPASLLPYRNLAQQMSGVLTMIGIMPHGRDDHEAPPRSVEDLADRAVQAMRARQPQGPYRLLGLLSGGLVAFEMARQLHARGEKTEFLALVDTHSPSALKRAMARLGLAGPPVTDGIPIDDAALPEHLKRLYRRLRLAGRAYGAGPYDGAMLLCIASDSATRIGDPSLGWGGYAPRLEVAEIGGTHDQMIREPMVGQVARLLTEKLSAA